MVGATRSEGITVTHALVKRISVLACAALLLGGCASSTRKDPIEGFNRAMFGLNEAIDKAAIKPLAKGYDFVLPSPVKKGVANFFGNVDDVFIGVNNLLQGKGITGASDLGRFVINSTVGIFGLFDVASTIGMEKHDEDFGQTFGRWGIGPGAYVVVPFFGPRTARDTVGLVLDVKADPVAHIKKVRARNTLLVTRVISDRSQLLPADKVIEEAALDKYTYIRDGYLQRRRNLIYDGDPPREKEDF